MTGQLASAARLPQQITARSLPWSADYRGVAAQSGLESDAESRPLTPRPKPKHTRLDRRCLNTAKWPGSSFRTDPRPATGLPILCPPLAIVGLTASAQSEPQHCICLPLPAPCLHCTCLPLYLPQSASLSSQYSIPASQLPPAGPPHSTNNNTAGKKRQNNAHWPHVARACMIDRQRQLRPRWRLPALFLHSSFSHPLGHRIASHRICAAHFDDVVILSPKLPNVGPHVPPTKYCTSGPLSTRKDRRRNPSVNPRW
ncbi:hypothetical protein B0T25DRAFT_119647 [Lasiosphaeria hispida]|uniref:Uncharacterized protein n=1 Tax=Lasiosphaeria hispida TaxID=260671 RepID=A0AAJ0HRF3_9PEZI|nr:hypothetical protein B0T25DRAFT_119647 [Lasiosphaeria hispida]